MLLRDDVEQTMSLAWAAMARARAAKGSGAHRKSPELYLESLGVSDAEKDLAAHLAGRDKNGIDPVVQVIVGATSGYSYKHLIGKLETYPIPDLRLPQGNGKALLDIGCNWGRWSVAAARKGYRVIGIDISLGAVTAAKRVARQLGVDIECAVADARHIPFEDRQ